MSKFHNWCYTKFLSESQMDDLLRNPNEFMEDVNNHDNVVYHICQLEEAPLTKNPHIQGYIELKRNIGMGTLKKILLEGSHMERARGNAQQNYEYCTKKETRLAGPWEWGKMKEQGKRNDLVRMYDMVKSGADDLEILEKETAAYLKFHKACDKARELILKAKCTNMKPVDKRNTLKVTALIGPPGVGKSSYVYNKHPIEEIYSLPHTKNNWFNGYQGQPVLLIEEMGPKRIALDKFLLMLDIYPQQFEVKNGMTWNNWTTIYLTSNYEIEDWFPRIDECRKEAVTRRIHNTIRLEPPKIIDYEPFMEEASSDEDA